MATNAMLWLPVLIVLLGGGVGGGELDLAGTDGTRITRIRQISADLNHQRLPVGSVSSVFSLLRKTYLAEIGVREATGRNDGPRIAEYLAYCGLAEGYEWCAAFVSWCHGQAGYPKPRNAWAAALFPAQRIIWQKSKAAKGKDAPEAGDVFGIYIASKKRIGHCGFVDAWDGTWCLTVEGNVDNAVVRKRRAVKSIHAVARWW